MPDLTTIPVPAQSEPASDLPIPEHVRRLLARRAARWSPPLAPDLPLRPERRPRIGRRARLPGRRRMLALRPVCVIVRLIAMEMIFLVGGTVPRGRDRRFAMNHIQQISIYVSHVVLQLTMTDIAAAYGLDRTTVGHACARVEDRRDDQAYDLLIAAIERVVDGVFAKSGAVRL